MEEFKDYVNKIFTNKGLDFNKFSIRMIKKNNKILFNEILKEIK